MFKRTRYQEGSLQLEERKRGPSVWIFRWWDRDINGKRVCRKVQVGSREQYQTESAARTALDALQLTINNQSKRANLRKTTIRILWEHYRRAVRPGGLFYRVKG